jgi:hypothetical protein
VQKTQKLKTQAQTQNRTKKKTSPAKHGAPNLVETTAAELRLRDPLALQGNGTACELLPAGR